MKFFKFIIVNIVIVLLLGCFGGGSSSTTSTKAFDFTTWPNGIDATSLTKNIISLFPLFTDIGNVMLLTLENADPNNSPYDQALCSNAPIGTAVLAWLDNDNNLELSTGDIASFTINSCDLDNSGELVSGDLTFSFSNVDTGNTPKTISMAVKINFMIPEPSGLITFLGGFGVVSETVDDINYTITYTAPDSPDQVLSISQSEQLKFGCFEVEHTFNIGNPDSYDLRAAGVINSANYIFSLADGQGISFTNDLLYSGTQRLVSQSVPNCGSVGAPNGVSDSNGAYVDIEAQQANDLVLIKVFDINDNLTFETSAIWSSL